MQETQVQALGWEDPLGEKKKTATHSSILAWEIQWTKEPGRLQSVGSQRVGHNLVTTTTSNVGRCVVVVQTEWWNVECRKLCGV